MLDPQPAEIQPAETIEPEPQPQQQITDTFQPVRFYQCILQYKQVLLWDYSIFRF